MRMKNHPQYFISKRPRRSSKVGITIGIDLGDIWSHYCTLNKDGEVVDRGRFRTNPSGVDKRFRDPEHALPSEWPFDPAHMLVGWSSIRMPRVYGHRDADLRASTYPEFPQSRIFGNYEVGHWDFHHLIRLLRPRQLQTEYRRPRYPLPPRQTRGLVGIPVKSRGIQLAMRPSKSEQ